MKFIKNIIHETFKNIVKDTVLLKKYVNLDKEIK